MSIANVNGVDIHYDLAGEQGPVLVFANAVGTDLVMWESQVQAFKDDFRVLRYDMRGHGSSGAPPGPYTIELLSRDVLGLIDHLGFSKFSFCGISLGGVVGQWLGINASNKLDKLILAATTPNFLSANFEERIKTVREKGLAGIADSVVNRWFTRAFQIAAPQQVDRVAHMTVAASEAGYIACCEALMAANFADSLSQIKTPTLCIAGSDDHATSVETVTALANAIPSAKLEVIANGAHLINLEQPQEFNRILRNFLEN